MKTERNTWLAPPARKVEKLYNAVTELLEEGRDINTLTVSEITEKAGIGKGTAYEYFRSKEEMIVKAVLYGRDKDLRSIEKRVEAQPAFREKYMEILRWMEEISTGKGSGVIFRHMVQESMQLSNAMKEEISKYGCNPEFVFETAGKFLHQWNQKEILISELPEELQCCMMLSSLAAFWVYLNRNLQTDEEERERVKEYLYRCLISNLSKEKL